MARARALAVSAAASAALHALPLALVGITSSLHWPEAPLPIEVREARARAKPPGPEQRGVEAKEPPKGGKTAKGPGRGHPRAPGPPAPVLSPPPQTADLRAFAPGDARIVVLLRADRLRASPYKEGAEELLEALPDYRTLLAGTKLTALDDFDALLIATADPFDVTATFLAARHRDDPRLRAALSERTIPPWDPRVFRFLSPRLSVLTRPDAAARLDGARDAGADDPRAGWLAELERFERSADEPGSPALLVTVSDLPAIAQLQNGLPTPLSAALAATAEASPALRLRLAFASEDEAARFEAEWPAIVKRWRAQALLLGLAPLLDGLKAERSGSQLDLLGRLAPGQMRLALSWARALVPRPADEAADGGAAARGDAGTPH